MHIKVRDIDKFSAIKEEACWALCESLNNKVLPTMGHWEKLSDLYRSWCLGCFSFQFYFIWGNLHVFGTLPQIPSSSRMTFLFKQCLNSSSWRELCKAKSPQFSNYLLLLFKSLYNPSNVSNTERYQLSGFVLLDLSWYLGICLSSSSNQKYN